MREMMTTASEQPRSERIAQDGQCPRCDSKDVHVHGDELFCDRCEQVTWTFRATTTQPEPATATPAHDFSNWRVHYVAPTQPEHTFEPRCWIEADSAEFGKSCRVFDVPDPDEGQRAAAQVACDALNHHAQLVAALERFIDASRESDPTAIAIRIDAARQQAETLLTTIRQAS